MRWSSAWQRMAGKVLRIERIGAVDDFFELGAILCWRRRSYRMCDLLGVEVYLRNSLSARL